MEPTEEQIKAVSTAPRITPACIEASISSEHYFTAGQAIVMGVMKAAAEDDDAEVARIKAAVPALKLLTFCVLVLRNGFTVTGESACASPENFDPEIGRKIARANAVTKVWPLLGFRLRDRLCAEAHAESVIEGQEPGSIV